MAKEFNSRRILNALLKRGEKIFTNKENDGILGEFEGMVETADTQECETADVVVSMRVADTSGHAPNSTITQCASCNHDIWLSPSSPMQPPKVCMRCVDEYTEDELFERIGRKQ